MYLLSLHCVARNQNYWIFSRIQISWLHKHSNKKTMFTTFLEFLVLSTLSPTTAVSVMWNRRIWEEKHEKLTSCLKCLDLCCFISPSIVDMLDEFIGMPNFLGLLNILRLGNCAHWKFIIRFFVLLFLNKELLFFAHVLLLYDQNKKTLILVYKNIKSFFITAKSWKWP